MWPEPFEKPVIPRHRSTCVPKHFQVYKPAEPSENRLLRQPLPSRITPPPRPPMIKMETVEDVKPEKRKFQFGVQNPGAPRTSFQSSPANRISSYPPQSKSNPVNVKLEVIETEEPQSNQENERLDNIKNERNTKSLPEPDNWPRLKIMSNYDEDSKLQRAAMKLEEEIRQFRRHRQKTVTGGIEKEDEIDEVKRENKENEEAWAVIEECSSEGNRLEATELIEYKNHDWCIALRICREKVDKTGGQLLVYSYQCGIQRLSLTTEQIDSLGETMLIKYKTKLDGSSEVMPIYSALPSTGLLSLKYRNNKGIELRVYGIANFVDFDKDPDSMSHKTMIWTDSLGPIYLTAADRSNIRRKLMMLESKVFAPLRMCQITVKGEFTSNVLNGTFLKWTIASFTPMIEETTKDPNIGRHLWPARVIRLDDLVREAKKASSSQQHAYHHSQPSPTGSWLRSISDPSFRVFAGTNLTGILESAGPAYSQKGVMMAYVVPCFHQSKFIFYEALIVGPARVVMLITEGRFLNYPPKTFSPTVQRLNEESLKRKERKQQVHEAPPTMKQPEYRLKSKGGHEEFHFDFNSQEY